MSIKEASDIRPSECRLLAIMLRGMSYQLPTLNKNSCPWDDLPREDRERWALFAARAWGVMTRLRQERQLCYVDIEEVVKKSSET